jgi:2-dehydro-3-deoxyphosphogluconate aldolase / (4S)-4-hydroxy-2-oxoglutarate aldolase
MHAIFRETRVIPVVTIEHENDAVPLARALARGGLNVVEVTLRTAAALAAISAIAHDVPEVVVGAGTVLRDSDVTRALAAGARFLVSPGLSPELAAAGLASNVPFIPGAMTPSEVIMARDLGFSFLKFYPAAGAGGVATLRNYALVFAGIAFCPTGGVTGENARDYLALSNVPVVGGAWMATPESIAAADWSGITERARRASAG